MYDYYLGGSANFATDRDAADELVAKVPEIQLYARANRAFMMRAVRYLCGQGINQFLDLGSGIPTVGNVHEIAHRYNPIARVAYVDVEPMAVSHARQLLRSKSYVTVSKADIRDPAAVLNAPGVAELLDFTRPLAISAVSILPFVSDADDPVTLMARYRQSCVAGSYLVVSHGSALTLTDEQMRSGQEAYRQTTTPAVFRTPAQIRELLPGYELLEPGMVRLPEWRPDSESTTEPWVNAASTNGMAAVGYLPAT